MEAKPSETIDSQLALVSMHSASSVYFPVSLALALMISKPGSRPILPVALFGSKHVKVGGGRLVAWELAEVHDGRVRRGSAGMTRGYTFRGARASDLFQALVFTTWG